MQSQELADAPPKWAKYPDIWKKLVMSSGHTAYPGAVRHYKNKLKKLGLSEELNIVERMMELLDLVEGADKNVKGDKEAYTKFFNKMLKKYKAKSPADLSDADKKKFFDELDKNWKADKETD